jgi:hypothetical protein
MPVQRTTDEQGRVHLRLRQKQSLALQVVASVVTFGVLFALGPGLLSLGTMRVEVTCERAAGQVRCDVQEGVLWGYLHVQRHADDVREVALLGKDTGSSTRVSLLTGSGDEVRVVSLSSDRNLDDKEALVSTLRAFFVDAAAPRVEARRDFVNLFAPVGGLCTVAWLLVLGSALALPRYALRPQVLVVDAGARKFSLRERPGSATMHELPFADVKAVAVTMNQGGWTGKLTEAANTDEAGRPRTNDPNAVAPPLHVALQLANGQRLVLVNTVRLTDDEVRHLAGDVSKLLGAKLAAEPKPAPG